MVFRTNISAHASKANIGSHVNDPTMLPLWQLLGYPLPHDTSQIILNTKQKSQGTMNIKVLPVDRVICNRCKCSTSIP